MACPNTGCRRKVENEAQSCMNCNTSFEAPIPKFVQTVAVRQREGVV